MAIRERGYSLAVLLRIKRNLMNIDCRLLKSRAAMTAQWGLEARLVYVQ